MSYHIRHRLAYLLRLAAWKLDPRPELAETIDTMMRTQAGDREPDLYPTPGDREQAYRDMLDTVALWQGRGADSPDPVPGQTMGDRNDMARPLRKEDRHGNDN